MAVCTELFLSSCPSYFPTPMRETSTWRRLAIPLLVALGLLLVAPASVVKAQLTPEQVAQLRDVGEAEVSPDGAHVAYTVMVQRDPMVENGTAYEELHVMNLATGLTRPFVTGEVNVNAISWTPDGTAIAFLARRDGDDGTALYTIPLTGGEAQRALHPEQSILAYDWHPEGTHVAFIARDEATPANSLPYQPVVYEELPRNRGAYVAALDGTAPRRLGVEGSAYAVRWSPDGSRLAVSAAPTPLVDDQYMLQRVYVVDAASRQVTGRVENPGKLGMVAWSPDGRHLAVVSAANINDPKEGRLMVASAAGGALDEVLPDFEGHVEQIVWDDDDTIRFSASRGVGSVYGTVNRDGSDLTWLMEADAVAVGHFAVADDRDLTVLVANTPQHPDELYLLRDGQTERLTTLNPWLADVRLADQTVVRYEARDGLAQEGMLIYPLDYQEGQRYPTILVVHGGPEAHYDNGWLTSYSTLGQVAAARGYAVFYPNYRGSTGRGLDYSLTSQGDPAGKEFDDLVDAADHLIEMGLADGDSP